MPDTTRIKRGPETRSSSRSPFHYARRGDQQGVGAREAADVNRGGRGAPKHAPSSWWARRRDPLSGALCERAVEIFAQMVDDPSEYVDVSRCRTRRCAVAARAAARRRQQRQARVREPASVVGTPALAAARAVIFEMVDDPPRDVRSDPKVRRAATRRLGVRPT